MAQQFDYPKTEIQLREIQDKLYQHSKEVYNAGGRPAFKGLLEVMSAEATIITAIHNIKGNRGSETPGVDSKTMRKDYLQRSHSWVIKDIQNAFKHFEPQKIRRVYIDKPGKTEKRPLGIPTIRDRIVQECMRIVLEPIFEAQFFSHSYQQDQHQMAVFAERAASPYTDVTITFFGGRAVRIPEKEYNYETIPSLKYRYGDILDTRNEADDESVVQGALHREHECRERMPKGHIAAHVKRLEESRIQAEADRLASVLQRMTEPNTPDKTHYMEKVSPYFLPLTSQNDMYRLFEKVQAQVKQPMYISTVEGASGQYFFMRREERTQEQSHKPSIKVQLAASTAAQTEKPTGHQHQKNKESR